MTRKPVYSRLTDAQLDAALSTRADRIDPTAGFVDSVMAVIQRESAAPAPIPFPWRRAFPGLVAALATLAFLAVLVTSVLGSVPRNNAAVPDTSLPMHPEFLPLFHVMPSPAAFGLVISAVVTLGTLVLCRRLLSAH